MKFYNWILNIFGVSKENQEVKLLDSPEEKEYLTVVKKDRTMNIISESQDNIKKIHELCKLSDKTIYKEKFDKVLELTRKIHDKIIEDDKVSKNKLEQFHMYYTDEFINTFDEALNDLKPKVEVKLNLKSDYKLQKELEIKRSKKEQEDILENINSMGIKERIELIIRNINNKNKLIQEKEFHDSIREKGITVTYADKYSQYLIDNWKISKNVKFIGELNDKKESPIVYDIETLDVFKILYDSTTPEKIGNIKDENIKEIVKNNFKKVNA